RAAAVDQFRILTVGVGGDLTLNKLTITGGQTDDTDGGGILVNAGGQLTARHSAITRNIAGENGGGIASFGVTVLEHATVSRNISDGGGGGVFNFDGNLKIFKSELRANVASSGGAVSSTGPDAVVTVAGSRLVKNDATGRAGGLLILGDGIGVVSDTEITGNTATAYGGMYADGQATLRKVKLMDNASTIDEAGGLFVTAGSAVVIEKSFIKGNFSADTGGGVHNVGELVIRETKIIDNLANQGGGIYNAGGMISLFDTQIVKNTAVVDGGGIFNAMGGTVELNTATGTIVVKNRPNNCVLVPGCAG
ncbi:right-handed parallel beta-helix repeat-containing protein, partial [Salinispora sp. H7-4]|uniref:right-handed parallel beta-helix repeat-containing protein n=1 Tax=Salinispora sp. H7-4 TaxID=2748321 RepID=UPI0021032698